MTICSLMRREFVRSLATIRAFRPLYLTRARPKHVDFACRQADTYPVLLSIPCFGLYDRPSCCQRSARFLKQLRKYLGWRPISFRISFTMIGRQISLGTLILLQR